MQYKFEIDDEDLLNNYRVMFKKNDEENTGMTYSLSVRAFVQILAEILAEELKK